MELLPEGQRNTAEVTWEDQQKINRFSTLISKKDEQEALLTKLRTEKEYFDDLALELELVDEEEKVQYKIGEIFVFMKVEKILQKIETENEKLDAKINKIDTIILGFDTELAELKSNLYAKFGRQNINLER